MYWLILAMVGTSFFFSFFFGEQSWTDYYLLAVCLFMLIIFTATHIKRTRKKTGSKDGCRYS
ncbi:hypothetical protein SAMN05518683_104137 [Salibacterium halotolerans]|uniref:Uncharacterized protein n=1 Tax=Salibacterium halotolerans TaxID=1884432 RepID=A0A1I5PIA7_9BACI|nr:hypothetical protein SAMN05518683_104137 [Salibacterium halotolerans]